MCCITHRIDYCFEIKKPIFIVIASKDKLNFSCSYTRCPDGESYGTDLGNGTFNGCMGSLQRADIDFGSIPVTPTVERTKAGDSPTVHLRISLISKNKTEKKLNIVHCFVNFGEFFASLGGRVSASTSKYTELDLQKLGLHE